MSKALITRGDVFKLFAGIVLSITVATMLWILIIEPRFVTNSEALADKLEDAALVLFIAMAVIIPLWFLVNRLAGEIERRSAEIVANDSARVVDYILNFTDLDGAQPHTARSDEKFGLYRETKGIVADLSARHGVGTEVIEIAISPDRLKSGSRDVFRTALGAALENALVHAGASKIAVKFKKEHEYFSILVSDDGKGIPEEIMENEFVTFNVDGLNSLTNHISKLGSGFPLMMRAMASVDGEVAIGSSPENGTTIVFRFPNSSRQVELGDNRGGYLGQSKYSKTHSGMLPVG